MATRGERFCWAMSQAGVPCNSSSRSPRRCWWWNSGWHDPQPKPRGRKRYACRPFPRDIDSHYAKVVSSDRQWRLPSEDLVFNGPAEGNATGDITGSIVGTFGSILYVADACRTGLITGDFTLTDATGNSFSVRSEGPRSTALLPEVETSASSTTSGLILTGGTASTRGSLAVPTALR